MKIAMFGHKRIPSREGGVEIVVEELASRMVKTGNEVTCFNRNGKGCVSQKYGKRYNFNGIEVKTVPTIDKKGMAAVTAAFFSSVMAAFGKYDIVHIHAEGPAFFSWIPKLFHKKIVVTVHGLVGSVKSGKVDLAPNSSAKVKKMQLSMRMRLLCLVKMLNSILRPDITGLQDLSPTV